jgi:hypothetical protein
MELPLELVCITKHEAEIHSTKRDNPLFRRLVSFVKKATNNYFPQKYLFKDQADRTDNH